MGFIRPATAIILSIATAASAHAQVVTISDSEVIPQMPTDWTETRSLDKFNPALGNLLSITLTAEASIIGSAAFESLDMDTSTVTLQWQASIAARRADNNQTLALANPVFQNATDLGPHDGGIDFAGPSGASFPNLFESDSDSQQFFPPFTPDIENLFIGPGTFDVNVDALGLSMATGPGNLVVQFTTDATATITVTYEYQGILDCNDNEIPDDEDIANMTSDDCNTNGIPDECEFDCNGNGIPDDCDPEECPCFEFNRRMPGSLLLYPEYRNGPGRVTVYTVTNANCNQFSGATEVEFRYIAKEDCSEANQEEVLTPCDTYTFLTSTHTGVSEGYGYIYAKRNTSTPANPAGEPHVFNHLIGELLVIDGWDALDYAVNAVSFKGVGAQGMPTDQDGDGGNGDGIRDLDNQEYEPAPDRIFIPRFLGQDVGMPMGVNSELILINLSGGAAFRATPVNSAGGTTISILGFNDNEEIFSAEYTFSCWDRVPLLTLSSSYGNNALKGLGDDPFEIAGAMGRESGWFKIDGLVANSTVESIVNPAIYAVLVEQVRGKAAADLPFEYCSQENGDLLPRNIFGDFPFVEGDNQ